VQEHADYHMALDLSHEAAGASGAGWNPLTLNPKPYTSNPQTLNPKP